MRDRSSMTLSPDFGAATGNRLTIDLGALAANWRTMAGAARGAEASAVLKADAYGIGLEQAGEALTRAGARTFFVALPDEGRRLRAVVGEAPIYVLNGFFPGAAPVFLKERLRPVLGGPEEIDAWLAATRGAGEPAAIHLDTGMNRLGLTAEEAEALARDQGRLAALKPALVMTHFACADCPGHPLTAEQVRRFDALRSLFPGVPASFANSAAHFLDLPSLHDLTRPGIALYGGQPGAAAPLKPVATLQARIVRVREVAEGAAVGYGAAFVARRPSRIAVLSAGYADGYLRRAGASDAGPGAMAGVGGVAVPLAGRVSMDLIAVDVTDAPAEAVRVGAWVELFGPTIPIQEVAAAAGTIDYELLTSLGTRSERRYIA